MDYKFGKKHLSYWDLFIDSIKYSLSDWVAILIFGVILLFLSSFESYVYFNLDYLFSKRLLVACVITVVLSFLESGYSFKIIEETINGSKKPPLFVNYKELFEHGFKDTIVYLTYFGLLAIIILIALILNELFQGILYEIYILILILTLISGIIILYLLGSLLNLAKNEGKLKAAFDFKTIRLTLKEIGYSRLIIVYLFGLVTEYLIVSSIFHLGIFATNSLLSFIVNLIVTPFIAIFTERLFALSSL